MSKTAQTWNNALAGMISRTVRDTLTRLLWTDSDYILALPRELVPGWRDRVTDVGQGALGDWASHYQEYIEHNLVEPYRERHIAHKLIRLIPRVTWGFLAPDCSVAHVWSFVATEDGGLLLGESLDWAPEHDAEPFADLDPEKLDWWDLQGYVDLDGGDLVLFGIEKDVDRIDWENTEANDEVLVCPLGHGRYRVYTATYRSDDADHIIVRLRRKPELVGEKRDMSPLPVDESPYVFFEIGAEVSEPWPRIAEQLCRALNCVFHCARGDGSFADGAVARVMGWDLRLSAVGDDGVVRLSARPSVEAKTWTQRVDISASIAGMLASKGMAGWRVGGA